MEEIEVTTQANHRECPSCVMRGEKLQAIGASIFLVSLCSFGLLLPFSILAAIVIQSLSLRKCKECRDRAKKERRATRASPRIAATVRSDDIQT